MRDPKQPPPSSRERILDAAIQVFAAKGFATASTREISEAAGIKEPLLFYHFKSKASLYLAAFEDQIAKLAQGLDVALAEQEDAWARLRTFVECYLAYHIDYEPGLGVTVRELNGLPEDLATNIARMHHDMIHARLIQLLKSGVDSGAFRPIDARASAVAILGIMLLFLRLLPREYGQFTRAQMIEQVLGYYAAGLRPDVAAPFRGEPVRHSTGRPSALTGRRN